MSAARFIAVHENGRVHMETATPDGKATGTWAQFGEVCTQANAAAALADALRELCAAQDATVRSGEWDALNDPGKWQRARAALDAAGVKS